MTEPAIPQVASTQNDSPHEHISSIGSSVAIWIALLICTGLTAGVAFIDMGPFNTIVALSIATFKAILVILFFMHVKYTHEKTDWPGDSERNLLLLPPPLPEHGRLRHPPLAVNGGTSAPPVRNRRWKSSKA